MKIALALLAAALLIAQHAQANDVLTAAESDPVKMGWMQGFPPTKDRLISAADGSFFTFPALRWSVVHMREFLPTTEVSRGIGAPTPLPYALDDNIDALTFTPLGGTEPMRWGASLAHNYTDGILILHQGKVVYERYFAELSETKKHSAMSVTKSFIGTLAAVLVAEGKLDPNAKVVKYIPELKGTAFADATVQQVMDMTTSLSYSEDYADPNADVWRYGEAGNPFPKPKNYSGPVGYDEFLLTLKKQPNSKHGQAFAYKTPNTELLGWILARATNMSVAELLSERIWSKLGMEQSAYFQVDAKGTPAAGGGMSAGLRDMARFGQLMLNEGRWHGEQVLPKAAVQAIQQGGDPAKFAKAGYELLPRWSYKNMWWVTHNNNGAYAARGVHGQTIYIDPVAQMVIVRFASHPVSGNAANDPTSLPAYEAVAEYLLGKE